MRNRSTSEGPESGTYIHLKNGVVYSTYTSTVLSSSKVISDVVTPRFNQRIRNGDIVNNPCNLTNSVETAGGSYSYYAHKPGTTYTSSGNGSLTRWLCALGGITHDTLEAPSISVSNALEQAKSAAIANMDVGEYAFMEDAFEIRETLRLLRHPLTSLKSLHRAFTRRQASLRAAGMDRASAIADAWLQYRFAFSPLVRSVMDATEYAMSLPVVRPSRLSSRGKRTYRDITRDADLIGGVFHFRAEKSAELDARAHIMYEVTNPRQDANFQLGFTLADLPETIWAVMPYSFMVDRMINVSDAIRGLTNLASPRLKILAASTTERQLTSSLLEVTDQDSSSYTISISGDPWVKENFSYTRVPWDPSVSDTLASPDWSGLVQDATSIADLAALLTRRL